MKIIDISKNIFDCPVFKGDQKPQKIDVLKLTNGDEYNLSNLLASAHNGTHIDAPKHIVLDGADIGGIDLKKCAGPCIVTKLSNLKKCLSLPTPPKRILIKKGVITPALAKLMVKNGVDFCGVEDITVGDKETHRILLCGGVVVCENLQLNQVDEGEYFVCALPVNFGEMEGAYCRAVLFVFD